MSDDNKIRLTVSLDRDVAQFVRSKDNMSGFVNRILREEMTGQGIDRKLLTMRREMVEEQIDELESRQHSKRAALAEIEARLERSEKAQENIIDEAAGTLQIHQLNEDNPAVVHWAEQAGIDEAQLIQAVEDRMDGST